MKDAACLSLALIGWSTSALAEFIPSSEFSFGNWQGGAYTDNVSGYFSHCAVSASYLSDDVLYFSRNSDGSVNLAVESPRLAMEAGATYPIAIFIDNLQPIFGTAEAMDGTFVVINLPNVQDALGALQRGRYLFIEGSGWTGEYDLTGTYRALDYMRSCAERYAGFSMMPPSTSPDEPETNPPGTAAFDQSTLYQVATQMITSLGVQDFRYLTAEEVQHLYSGNAVLWSSEEQGVFGGVMAMPFEGVSELRETDPGDITFLANACAGELATTSRNVSMETYPAREVRSLCIQDGSETESYLTKMLIDGWVLYTWLEFGASADDADPRDRQATSEDVAIQAASFVAEAMN